MKIITKASCRLLLISPFYWLSAEALAHAEHDRARFVATSGVDKGRCDSPVRACRSISYAVKQANKGDKVLVATGEYAIENGEDLFMLTSALVPVLGGFNKFDHFQSQAPQLNATILTGVPQPYAAALQQQGFVVVNDGFARARTGFAELATQQAELQQSHGPTACVDGKAGVFSCRNIDLVSHLALGDFSSEPKAANDIWGHVDLNTGTEYAIIGLHNGTAVVSLADPAAPAEVGTIPGSNTSWRDIKVLQYYDASLARFKAYAYISSEGSDRLQIVDLSELPAKIRLVSADPAVTSAHNVYISHVDYTTNLALDGKEPALHIVGQKTVGGSFTTYGLKNPELLQSYFPNSLARGSDYTHDAASAVITDSRAQNSCGLAQCTVLADFNEESVRFWNISQLNAAGALAELTYPEASYVHSGWWTEDNRFVFVHDELDETTFGLNTTVRVVQLDDLQTPKLVKEWEGPSKAIDHNGFVRGNRYYISNYQRGTTILDITNPANPTEAGFFDSFPSSDGAAFNGVWGTYPYLPSGLIISSDINSGLYVLRDQSKTGSAGTVAFATTSSKFAKTAPVQVTVQRPAGSGAVSVRWETLNGYGLQTDSAVARGELQWAAADLSDKTIQFNLPADKTAANGLLFVRLLDPKNGLSLGTPSYHQVQIGDVGQAAGSIGFTRTSQDVDENSGTVTLSVGRIGGQAGPMQIGFQLQDGTAKAGSDFVAQTGELAWADGDSGNKTIQLQLLDDTALEGNENFSVKLHVIQGALLPTGADMTLQIIDNEVNRKPVLQLNVPTQANAGATVSLQVTATDADGDSLSYQWQQTSGTAVTLQNATTASASFVAPAQNASLDFTLTVSDNRGGSTVQSLTVQVKAADVVTTPVTPPATTGGSGGSLTGGWWVLLACGVAIRRQAARRGTGKPSR